MLKSIGKIMAGVFAAGLVVFIVEMAGHKIYPVPADLNYNDKEALAAHVKSLPVGALLWLIAAWLSGSFCGSALVSYLDTLQAYRNHIWVGVTLLLATAMNLVAVPHPFWMWIAGLVAIAAGTRLGYLFGLQLGGYPKALQDQDDQQNRK